MPDPLVELEYTLSEDDWLEGFVAHRRHIRRPWLVPLLVAAALVGLLLGRALGGGPVPTSLTDAAVTVAAVGLGLLLCWRLVVARWLHRWQARLLIRGNPWLSKPIRAFVDDNGLLLASPSRAETSPWSHYLRYVETERSFVLRESELTGSAVLVLPKRGLVEADPSLLRSLLEAHCHRSA
ncbi:YcxB family protein [Asanoa sp. NPDC049573]|uniref:YcxB family protein n=1 Tax=Asanoa sp. NPDC049573 TaxID=3155396 RepID=UPI00342F41E9